MKKNLRIFLFIVLLTQFSSCQKEKTITAEVFLQNVFETQSISTKSLSADILVSDRCKDLANTLEYWIYNEDKSHDNICALKFDKKYKEQWGYWEIQAKWENNKWENFIYTACGTGFLLQDHPFAPQYGKCLNLAENPILKVPIFTDLYSYDLSTITNIVEISLYQNTRTEYLKTDFLPPNLKILDVSNSSVDISTLDLSGTKITEILLNNNEKTKTLKAGFLPSSLEKLDISNSNVDISKLDLSETKITEILRDNNKITLKAEFLPPNLKTLDIPTSINISDIDLSKTKIPQLNLSKNTATKTLNGNFLPSNLEILDISHSTIDIYNTDLSKTKITKLNLKGNNATRQFKQKFLPPNLEILDLSNSAIDISSEKIFHKDPPDCVVGTPPTTYDIDLSNSKIIQLNLVGNTGTFSLKLEFLPTNLQKINLKYSQILKNNPNIKEKIENYYKSQGKKITIL